MTLRPRRLSRSPANWACPDPDRGWRALRAGPLGRQRGPARLAGPGVALDTAIYRWNDRPARRESICSIPPLRPMWRSEIALLPTQPDERILAVTPLYHSYALAMGLYLERVVSRNAHRHEAIPSPTSLSTSLKGSASPSLPAAPTLFNGLMQHENFGTTDFSSLRLCFSGAAALPVETLNCWRECDRLSDLRRLWTERSRPDPDVQSAARPAEAGLGRRPGSRYNRGDRRHRIRT